MEEGAAPFGVVETGALALSSHDNLSCDSLELRVCVYISIEQEE